MIIGAMSPNLPSRVATPWPASLPASGEVLLPHWGVIEAKGPDAAAFLQGQLTNDVASLDNTRWCLAGYCSAKGRLLANFIVWRPSPERFLLACSADLLEPTLKRLRMFVLRAKCVLSDMSSSGRLMGLWGDTVDSTVAVANAGRAWDGVANGASRPTCTTLRMHGLGSKPMAWVYESAVDPSTAVSEPAAQLAAGTLKADLSAWRWLEVASGVPRIVAVNVDAFVPQMVNLELLNGVNFRKGCYPGQEVVARSQYRGTLKRRMHAFETTADVSAGDEVFHASDAAQPTGVVVDAAILDDRGVALISLKSSALDPAGATVLHLRSPDGAAMHESRMPYPVPNEAADPA